ncbi:type I restriction enzyme, S subunit [Geopseudomonas sagittaria]|uniref:Type I restriction enzyme, S subunit n=1 Tax=Geopseudomonas sagittaria TaxID=1135990 RepID=A0A1I5THF0_9GAMM|nr:restriction endonuclease subunit S [Pseudomonas sagittaria]SFP82281.1 type I restriction enzyme, S subunit [Pseudomonas sagittaria]
MTALLTDNLPLLAGAPNGIQKLRELILELAVRGKLVPQDPSDEPASELLKRIAEEKARLVAEGKIRKQKPLAEIGEEEKPFELPEGWEWVRLGDSLEMINGRAFKPAEWKASGLPIVRIQNLNREDAPFNYCNEDDVDARHLINDGTFLISWSGTPGTSFGAFIWRRGKAALNQHIFSCVQKGKAFFEDFLQISINTRLDELISKAHGGVGLQHVTKGKLEALTLVLPPLAEQHRIVAKVDELMALCDRLEARQADADSAHARLVQALLDSLTQASDADDFAASWQRLAEHFHSLFTSESSIDALKQTLLQLAVMGKLVPQDPSDEPASELLKRIAEEKARLVAEGKLRKQKPLAEVGEGEKLFELPQGWQWVRKTEVFNFLNGYAFKSEWFKPEGIRLLRNVNVSHGAANWKDTACISEEQAAEFQGFLLAENDVVLTLDRPIISTGLKYAVISSSDLPCLLLQRVAKIAPYAGAVSVGYLSAWLNSRFFVESIDPGRSNGVPHISTNQVASMPFALPPLPEQHRIVAKLDQLMSLCDQLKSHLTAARQLHERLAGVLVEQAVA